MTCVPASTPGALIESREKEETGGAREPDRLGPAVLLAEGRAGEGARKPLVASETTGGEGKMSDGHAIGVRCESEAERTPKVTAGKISKESPYVPMYSAIPRLQKRSIKGCVPRICQLRVSRIEALAPLTDKSETNVCLVVDVSDGRSRFRETARTMKVRRAALSSQPVQITPMENVEWPLNQVFYLQYFHNLRKNSDKVRILLKKERSKRLGKNTVAECTVNLADVLQCPIDDGQVIPISETPTRIQPCGLSPHHPTSKTLEQQPTCPPRSSQNFRHSAPNLLTLAPGPGSGYPLLQAKQAGAGQCPSGEDALLPGEPPHGPGRRPQVVARGG